MFSDFFSEDHVKLMEEIKSAKDIKKLLKYDAETLTSLLDRVCHKIFSSREHYGFMVAISNIPRKIEGDYV